MSKFLAATYLIALFMPTSFPHHAPAPARDHTPNLHDRSPHIHERSAYGNSNHSASVNVRAK